MKSEGSGHKKPVRAHLGVLFGVTVLQLRIATNAFVSSIEDHALVRRMICMKSEGSGHKKPVRAHLGVLFGVTVLQLRIATNASVSSIEDHALVRRMTTAAC